MYMLKKHMFKSTRSYIIWTILCLKKLWQKYIFYFILFKNDMAIFEFVAIFDLCANFLICLNDCNILCNRFATIMYNMFLHLIESEKWYITKCHYLFRLMNTTYLSLSIFTIMSLTPWPCIFYPQGSNIFRMAKVVTT